MPARAIDTATIAAGLASIPSKADSTSAPPHDGGGVRIARAARLAIALAVIVAACHDDVPRPTLPTPVAPEVTRGAPKPQPIDPAKQRKQSPRQRPKPPALPDEFHDQQLRPVEQNCQPPEQRARRAREHVAMLRAAAFDAAIDDPAPVPDDAGVNDVIDLPPVPDADLSLDAGQPLE